MLGLHDRPACRPEHRCPYCGGCAATGWSAAALTMPGLPATGRSAHRHCHGRIAPAFADLVQRHRPHRRRGPPSATGNWPRGLASADWLQSIAWPGRSGWPWPRPEPRRCWPVWTRCIGRGAAETGGAQGVFLRNELRSWPEPGMAHRAKHSSSNGLQPASRLGCWRQASDQAATHEQSSARLSGW